MQTTRSARIYCRSLLDVKNVERTAATEQRPPKHATTSLECTHPKSKERIDSNGYADHVVSSTSQWVHGTIPPNTNAGAVKVDRASHFKQAWLSFDPDLAWDIFTLVCILAALIAMLVAAGAGLSEAFSQLVADLEHWLWSTGTVLAAIAVVCLARSMAGRAHYPWEV